MTENPASPPVPKKGSSCLLKGAVILGVVLVIAVGFWFWINRPIRPVVLTAQEKQAVEAKVEAIQKPEDPKYEKGSKEIILTERELNGLLNENTSLGKSVSLQLATDEIHARVETDLDPDLPVVGGKKLKAKARFLVSDDTSRPHLILDDITVWGVSLPNDWLAGIKGQDLLGQVLGGGADGGIPGIKEFKVETGRMVILLKD